MTPERWEQVKSIFHAAVESDPALRTDLLDKHCGDDEELRREVESLLASDGEAGSVIEHPLLGSAQPEAGATVAMQVLKDRYDIERELGRGGMSVVYRAEDLRLKRKVALKLLAPELAEDERFRERFLRESKLAASLDHPSIVPIYDAGEVEGQLYIAMRYVEGSTIWAGVIPMSVVGVSRSFQINLAQFLTEYGLQLYNKLQKASIVEVLGAYPGLTISQLVKAEFLPPEFRDPASWSRRAPTRDGPGVQLGGSAVEPAARPGALGGADGAGACPRRALPLVTEH